MPADYYVTPETTTRVIHALKQRASISTLRKAGRPQSGVKITPSEAEQLCAPDGVLARAEIRAATLCRWDAEVSGYQPSLQNVVKVAEATGESLDYLLFGRLRSGDDAIVQNERQTVGRAIANALRRNHVIDQQEILRASHEANCEGWLIRAASLMHAEELQRARDARLLAAEAIDAALEGQSVGAPETLRQVREAQKSFRSGLPVNMGIRHGLSCAWLIVFGLEKLAIASESQSWRPWVRNFNAPSDMNGTRRLLGSIGLQLRAKSKREAITQLRWLRAGEHSYKTLVTGKRNRKDTLWIVTEFARMQLDDAGVLTWEDALHEVGSFA